MPGIAPGRDSSQRTNERCSFQITSRASICTDSGTLPSRASICAHSARASSVSRTDGVGLGDLGDGTAGVFLHAHQEGAPMRLMVWLVTAVAMIRASGGDAPLRRHTSSAAGSEVALQFLGQVRIFRDVRIQQLGERHQLE